jgi:hypothetical protein
MGKAYRRSLLPVVLAADGATRIGEPIMGKSVDKPDQGSRVPPAHLEEVLKPVKAKQTYPFEYFTQGDWDEVRSLLKPEYRWLSNKQLMHQACNLRKAGKLQDPAKREASARMKRIKNAITAYWNDKGTLEAVVELVKDGKPAPVAR